MTTQNILVTGTSGGFGQLITDTLIDMGHTVFATMRDPGGRNAAKAERLATRAQDKPGSLHVLELDVTDDNSVRGAVAKAVDIGGRIDVVVNNAGIGVIGMIEAFTPAQMHALFDINLYGIQRVNRAVLPAMRARGSGLLIHISSGLGRYVFPFYGPYVATKFALEGLAASYRYELSNTGVDSVIVEPGGFGTDFSASLVRPEDQDCLASYGDYAKLPEQILANYLGMLHSENGPNPQLVADAVAKLVDTPIGSRPLRTVVDPVAGAKSEAINKVVSEVQEGLFGGMGMSAMLGPKAG
jgi:NAD(P)-dependent dehydrogenase (short-subunit alcohol dehydrogenase family)